MYQYLFITSHIIDSFLLYVTRKGVLSILLFSLFSYHVFSISFVFLIYLTFQEVPFISSFYEFLFECCTTLLLRYSLMTLSDVKLNPKACNLLIRRSCFRCFRQPNTFDISVRTAEHTLFLSRASFIFSIMTNRQC